MMKTISEIRLQPVADSVQTAFSTKHNRPDAAALVARAEEIAATLVERQAETEARGFFGEDTHEAIKAAGLYRTLVPAEFGGLDADMDTYGKIVRAIARGCPSSAWQFCLGAAHAPLVCRLYDPSLWSEIFGDGHFICPFPVRPQGELRQLEDGDWSLTGTYNYCSGVPYATHLVSQAIPVYRDGSKGAPVVFLAQRKDWARLDDWGGAFGVKGSGSHSVRFDGARVPDRFVRHVDLTQFAPEPLGLDASSLHSNPARFGRYESFALFELASIAVGALTGALDGYGELIKSRSTIFPPIVPRIEDSDYRRWYGRTLGRLSMAEAALSNAATQWTEASRLHMLGQRPFGVAENMRLTLLCGEVIDIVWEAMQTLWSTMGTAPARDGERMQRVFRDLAMLRNHGICTSFDNMARRLADHMLGATPNV